MFLFYKTIFFSVRGGFVFNIRYDNICSHEIRSYSTAKRGDQDGTLRIVWQ